MSINLLPKNQQNELRKERIRRLLVVSGAAFFLVILTNAVLISPLWILFNLQKMERLRHLDALRQSPAFLRVTGLEKEIKKLNSEIASFNSQQSSYFSSAPAIKSLLESRPVGVEITSLSFTAPDPARGRSPMISISGVARNRELLLRFASLQEENPLFSRIHSPISNLIKEEEINYSLIVDLAQ